MHRRSISFAPTFALAAMLTLLLPAVIQAQSVKIVLPERFGVLSDHLFDLRVEATGLSSLNAQIQLVVDGDGSCVEHQHETTGQVARTETERRRAFFWHSSASRQGNPGTLVTKYSRY